MYETEALHCLPQASEREAPRDRDSEADPEGVTREVQEEPLHGARPDSLDSVSSVDDSPGFGASSGRDTGRKKKKRGFWGKLVRNPIFHVKATAWIIWGVCLFCVKGPEELTYMKLNKAIEGVVPLMNSAMNRTLPRSVGDCRRHMKHFAPPPCVGTGPLYAANTSGVGVRQVEEQHVLARWVTGVNTIRLKSVSVHNIPDSTKPIEVSISGEIADLKMSINIEQCWLGMCKQLWDSTDGCCKPHRHFELIIATDCSNDDLGFASLGKFKIEWFNIDDIVLSEDVLGFHQKLADLTPRVKSAVQELTTDIFQGDTMFLNLTFAQVVSRLWRYNTAGGLRCTDFLEDTK
jgi:hypothetical protein